MTEIILEFFVEGKKVPVKLLRTKNKNMYLKIKGEDIIISAPILTTKKTINKFVSENITKFVEHIELQKANKKYDFEEKYLFLLGKRYDFEIFSGLRQRSFHIQNDVIYINLKTGSREEADKYIKDFLKRLVTEKIVEVQRFWERQMNIPKHEILVVYKTSTWGTNMIGKKKISYSARLAHYDPQILQYIVIHELAHYLQPNHSKDFWNIVKLYMPNYKEIEKIIKLSKSKLVLT